MTASSPSDTQPTPSLPPASPFPSDGHDHAVCRTAALRRAEALCAGRGARFTDLRRRVLELLWEDHRPIAAYDVLHRLNADGRKAAPPAVYRALEFLIAQGLAHRLNSLNAFIGCAAPERAHGAQFFICRACGSVAEVRDPEIAAGITRAAETLGFTVQAPVVEVEGLCPHCRERGEDAEELAGEDAEA